MGGWRELDNFVRHHEVIAPFQGKLFKFYVDRRLDMLVLGVWRDGVGRAPDKLRLDAVIPGKSRLRAAQQQGQKPCHRQEQWKRWRFRYHFIRG